MKIFLSVISGVVRLGHTGARALATRGRALVSRARQIKTRLAHETSHAPPMHVRNRIIGADSIVVDHESGATLTWYMGLP